MPPLKTLALSAATSLLARPLWERVTARSAVNYEGHVPLAAWENALAAVGSGVVGLRDTKRGDLVALLSETSSQHTIPFLHSTLKSTAEGRQILADRPLLSSSSVGLDSLRTLQRGTLGREWVEWLHTYDLTPDTRQAVTHVDSPVWAYTMTRYRQTHDLYHTLFGLAPTLAYELALKYVEWGNMGQPVAGLSSVFGVARFSTAERRGMFLRDWAGWALRQGARGRPLIGVYWEKRWEQGLGELRRELGVRRMDDRAVEERWPRYKRAREEERRLRRRGEWIDEPEDW